MTTSRPNPASSRLRLLLPTVCFAMSMTATMANERSDMTLDMREASAGQPRSLIVAGTWPDSCVPRLLRVTRDGADLGVQLQVATQACVARPTAFDVPIETRTAFGSGAIPPQVYRVRISASRGGAAPELLGFRLLDLDSQPVLPESGFWWSRSGASDGASLAGGGIGLEVQGRQIAVSLLAFAADGVPTWYFGSADLDGRTAQVPLIRLLNGAGTGTDKGHQAGIEAGPLLALEFTGPSQAKAWLLGPTAAAADAPLALRPLVLRRAVFDGRATGNSWLGGWVLVVGRESRVVEFASVVTDDGESFRLLEVAGSSGAAIATLECRYRGNGSDAQVDGCSLIDAGKVTASFGQIGIDRLVGATPDSRPAQLLRLIR